MNRGGWKHALKGQPAHSPGQSEAAPWVKAFVSGCALQGQKRNIRCKTIHIIYAFALAGRYPSMEPITQGAASLCPGLGAGCPFRAYTSAFPRFRWEKNRLLYRRS